MLTTNEYLKYKPWDALITIINHRYRLSLDTETTELVAFTPKEGTRTDITLRAKRSTSERNLLPQMGERTFSYDRLDIGSYFGGDSLTISGVRPPISSYELVQKLSEMYDVVFSPDDFINEIIMDDDELANYTLTASPRSLRWVGSVSIRGSYEKIDLSQALGNRSLKTQLNRGHDHANRGVGDYHVGGYDFSQFRRHLHVVSLNNYRIPPKQMVDILRKVTGNSEWTCDSSTRPYNIASFDVGGSPMYEVVYNGPIKIQWSARDDMRHVLVIKLNPELCDNIAGHLVLHYR